MTPSRRKDTVVIGLGNPLMGDEGIGIAVVRALQSMPAVAETADMVELGASPLAVVHAVAGYRRAVIVDCARMRCEPGRACRFTPAHAASVKKTTGLSLHECELFRVLAISAELGEHPAAAVIIGIEPARIGPGEGLSNRLQQQFDMYLQLVLDEIRNADIPFRTQGGSDVYDVAVSGK